MSDRHTITTAINGELVDHGYYRNWKLFPFFCESCVRASLFRNISSAGEYREQVFHAKKVIYKIDPEEIEGTQENLYDFLYHSEWPIIVDISQKNIYSCYGLRAGAELDTLHSPGKPYTFDEYIQMCFSKHKSEEMFRQKHDLTSEEYASWYAEYIEAGTLEEEWRDEIIRIKFILDEYAEDFAEREKRWEACRQAVEQTLKDPAKRAEAFRSAMEAGLKETNESMNKISSVGWKDFLSGLYSDMKDYLSGLSSDMSDNYYSSLKEKESILSDVMHSCRIPFEEINYKNIFTDEMITDCVSQSTFELLKESEEYILWADAQKKWRHTDEEILEAVARGDFSLLERKLCYDKDFMLKTVARNGLAIAYASAKLQADKDVVLAAVHENGYALNYASEALRADKEVVLAACASCGEAIECSDRKLRADRDVILASIESYGWALRYAEMELRSDKETVMKAIANKGEALQFASEELRADREVVLKAIEKHGWCLNFASEKLRADVELQRIAATRSADVESIALEELELSIRSYHCLKRAGIETLGQLAAMSEEELMHLRNLGRKAFEEIKWRLAEYGAR